MLGIEDVTEYEKDEKNDNCYCHIGMHFYYFFVLERHTDGTGYEKK